MDTQSIVEQADRLFEPFVTSSLPTTYKYAPQSGSGLGLTVCKRLIKAAGGVISVSSRRGDGTIFTITLPARSGERT